MNKQTHVFPYISYIILVTKIKTTDNILFVLSYYFLYHFKHERSSDNDTQHKVRNNTNIYFKKL